MEIYHALQALRAVSHNYPNLMSACWERVSGIVYKILTAATSEVSPRTWRGQVGNTSGCIGEKVIAAAIKVRRSMLIFFLSNLIFMCIICWFQSSSFSTNSKRVPILCHIMITLVTLQFILQ